MLEISPKRIGTIKPITTKKGQDLAFWQQTPDLIFIGRLYLSRCNFLPDQCVGISPTNNGFNHQKLAPKSKVIVVGEFGQAPRLGFNSMYRISTQHELTLEALCSQMLMLGRDRGMGHGAWCCWDARRWKFQMWLWSNGADFGIIWFESKYLLITNQ